MLSWIYWKGVVWMLPDTDYGREDDFGEDFSIESYPNRTYAMKKERMIAGTYDHLKAVKQAVYKILRTERYEHAIYSWDYGIELKDLFGKNVNYVKAEIKHRIKEGSDAGRPGRICREFYI